MRHERVDIERWKSLFPLAELRKRATDFVTQRRTEVPSDYPDQKAVERHIELASPGAGLVVGPGDVAILELLREEAFRGMDLLQVDAVPTDVFIFARGEPERRDITKVGGLPYWPRGEAWPRASDGKPMTFCCQMNFADSRDLVGDLPGDILLIFACMEFDALMPEEVAFHWRNLGETDLVAEADLPGTGEHITPTYGAIYRTADYNRRGFDASIRGSLLQIEGFKIGGMPKWVDDLPAEIPGRFLCMVTSQDLVFFREYPWLNVPEPIETMEEMAAYSLLDWGWSGNLYIFIDAAGDIHWKIQGY